MQNADINETVNLVKTLAKVQTVAGNQALNAITVLGTLDQIAMADRIIELERQAARRGPGRGADPRGQPQRPKSWGIDLSNYTAGAHLVADGTRERDHGRPAQHPRASAVLAQPGRLGGEHPLEVFARFLQTDSTSRILAAPRLRAAEGKKAELKIGTEVPSRMTSYTVGHGAARPATCRRPASVPQRGREPELTPRVAASGDITMELTAEFSLLGDDRNVGSDDNPVNVPTFLTRNVTGTLRLRDGETGLIGGLLQGNEALDLLGCHRRSTTSP